MYKNAQKNFDFFETPSHYSNIIYKDYNPTRILNIIDICCGTGSLVQSWYDNNHNITLVEFNQEFIPILKEKYPKAKIIQGDFFNLNIDNTFDVFLCNPPFNTSEEKRIYISFFCKILTMMNYYSVLYFICPKMFYKDQIKIEIEIEITNKFELSEYVKQNNEMPAKYYYDKYNLIELHSNGFRFDKSIIKRMIKNDIIPLNFINEEDNMINPYYEFRYLCNIFDFKETKCKCGLFKIKN
jgi:ubiquinone/menaquinone biosynthesis C-methylase UbiE